MMASEERSTLVVLPSVPVVVQNDALLMDIKMIEGLSLYAKLWNGPVRCLARAGDNNAIAYGSVYQRAELPFEVAVIASNANDVKPLLEDAAVVLASGDNHLDFDVVDATEAPVVFIIEYTLATRLKINLLDRGLSPRMLSGALWTMRSERRRRRAFSNAAGLQANGQPASDAYRGLVPSTLRYFDSRMSDAQQIAPNDLARKQGEMRGNAPLRLAFSGRLERMKGADHLVPIAAELRRIGVDFQLAIFGDGALRQSIQHAIDREALGDRVTLKGSVPFDAALVPYLKDQVDLFVCCHRQADPSCTYLETLSCGVPIAGYDNAAFKGVLGLGVAGVATPIDDIRALAAAIRELSEDRERLTSMAAIAARIGREHSFETSFANRINHLKTIATAHQAKRR